MHSRHIRLALATAVAAAATGGLLGAAAGPSAAADSVHHHEADFNHDGIGDVAFSAGYATVTGHTDAGQIVVLYGTKAGLDKAHRTTFSQDSPGVPGGAETGDAFGWSSSYGDFNHDGFDDLAVGAAYEEVDGDKTGGLVQVLWGSPSGLSGGTTLTDPAPGSHDFWGRTLAAGDYDGDGKDDLAVGSSGASVYVFKGGTAKTGTLGGQYAFKPPVQNASSDPHYNGPVTLVAGDVNGDGRSDLVVDGYDTETESAWNKNFYLPGTASGLTGNNAVGLTPGIITDIGDVDNDGYGDIVSGIVWDKDSGVPGATDGGKVALTHGSASGPAGTTTISQNTGAVPGASEKGDGFGGELSLGDINGDHYLDLVVGADFEDIDGVTDTGSVTVLYGSAQGIDTTSNIQYFSQNSAGVPGADEKSDRFGSEVKLTDVTGDGRADLTIGSFGENNYDGQLTYLPSAGTKLTTTGGRYFMAPDVGVSTAGQPMLGGNAAN
ncbi:FG-GAP-like repeat-containing protein [Streptomyces sp. NPDC006552]|uniref:FG-GAP-like repeat-containing protein n=1 Tax=Streptomyces sp. NPDC006552 TaxID=3157179 RepID=UPI0033B18788